MSFRPRERFETESLRCYVTLPLGFQALLFRFDRVGCFTGFVDLLLSQIYFFVTMAALILWAL